MYGDNYKDSAKGGWRTATVWGDCLWGVGLAIDFLTLIVIFIYWPVHSSCVWNLFLAESQVTTSENELGDGVALQNRQGYALANQDGTIGES
jgi:hypothetical protein